MAVHIFGMGGGKRIKDATALPSDVSKGKVFYNNGGRQEGVNEELVERIKTFFSTDEDFHYQYINSGDTGFNYTTQINLIYPGIFEKDPNYTTYSFHYNYYDATLPDKIKGVIINGIRYPFTYDFSKCVRQYGRGSCYGFEFKHDENNNYCGIKKWVGKSGLYIITGNNTLDIIY